MNNDLLGSLLIFVTVGIFIILSEGTAKLKWLSEENSRKFLHISVGNIIFFIPFFSTKWMIVGIPLLFAIFNLLLGPYSPIERLRLRTFSAGHSFGTVFYPIALVIVIYLGFGHMWLIVASFLPLVYGDSIGALLGLSIESATFKGIGGEKSMMGTLSISAASMLTVLIGLLITGYQPSFSIAIACTVGIATPIIEILSPRGMDNLTIPPILFLILSSFANSLSVVSNGINVALFFWSMLLGITLAMVSWRLQLLTADGAMAGFILATYMLGLGGWVVGVQLFSFFFIGSMATKIVRKKWKVNQDEFEKGSSRRDSGQALAKAGIPAILTLFMILKPSLFYVITAIMTASLTDTMATEVGIAMGGKMRNVLRPWKAAEKGESGAISLQGTLGGFAFGILQIIIVLISAMITQFEVQVTLILVMPIFGVIGMLMDSIIGYKFQIMNRCVECGKLLETFIHHGKKTLYDHGFKFLNNDMVNFLGTSTSGLVATIYLLLISQI